MTAAWFHFKGRAEPNCNTALGIKSVRAVKALACGWGEGAKVFNIMQEIGCKIIIINRL